jgi:thiamine-monophosphate kinase
MSAGEDKITAWFAGQSGAGADRFPIGIGDDMAQVATGGSVLITTDMLLDGVHFDLSTASVEQAAYKAMAASLSDCAAMATVPVCAVVSVGLPAGSGEAVLKEVHAGVVRSGGMFGCELIGGDITAWRGAGKMVINVTMLSEPAEGILPVRRSGAKANDVICVTGTLGGSIEGKHLKFVPRVREAIAIAGNVTVGAMMDITDGVSRDLRRICTQSGVGAVVEAGRLPLSEAARKSDDPVRSGLDDGEDFELLFTVRAEDFGRLMDEWAMDVPITRIGEIVAGSEVMLKNIDGSVCELRAAGFDHLEGQD